MAIVVFPYLLYLKDSNLPTALYTTVC